MKHLYIFLLVLSLVSCKSEKEKNIKKLEEAIRQRVNDVAFKQNKPVKLLQISSVSYEMISQARIDTARLLGYIQKQDDFLALIKEYRNVIRDESNLAKLSSEAGLGTIAESNINKAKDNLEKLNAASDSLKYYFAQDSIIRIKLKKESKITDKPYYSSKCFLKATVGDQNYLDTIRFIFDKDFHLVN